MSDDEADRSVRRRTNAYQFDPDAYRAWSSGGAVWLGWKTNMMRRGILQLEARLLQLQQT
jgi:hypothetical protein